ncbi:MAG: PA0069 family radical SAM protein [Aquisalimonadaceae bacterium]
MPIKGRGALSNGEGRFESRLTEAVDDGWYQDPDDAGPDPRTVVRAETARSIITHNTSPDVPFDRSINPYRGCEHGCIYCFARPSHAYLNLSPGLDFETRLFYKHNAAEILEKTLQRPGYRCAPIVLGTNTDPYQPLDRKLGITRELLEVLYRYRHPVSIITKGSHVARDLDLLSAMAEENLAMVCVSLTTLDDHLKRSLEPRTASPRRRLDTIATLTGAGVPVSVLMAPVIPAINDAELEAILERAADAGAETANYVLLRLPHEVAGLFREWLEAYAPARAGHVMSLIRQSRGGKDYDARFNQRQRGTGHFAELLAQRFALACKRNGLRRRSLTGLVTDRFRRPVAPDGAQLTLW